MVKAIDIILLMPDELHKKLVKLNRDLNAQDVEQIELGGESIPHLSLGMAAIPEEQIPGYFEKISKNFKTLELKIKNISSYSRPSKADPVCHLQFELSDELQALHENVMNELRNTDRQDPQHFTFHGLDEIPETTIHYVKEFEEKHSFDNYVPHVTVGFGDSKSQIEPKEYTFDRLAICHLGKHNTCREILKEKHV